MHRTLRQFQIRFKAVFNTAKFYIIHLYHRTNQDHLFLLSGALIGLAVAWLGVRLLRMSALPASGLYPLGTVAIGMIAFAGAGELSASGLLAAYVAGVVVGNSGLPHARTTEGFCESLAWLAQIGLFTMLGLLASPARLLGRRAQAQ